MTKSASRKSDLEGKKQIENKQRYSRRSEAVEKINNGSRDIAYEPSSVILAQGIDILTSEERLFNAVAEYSADVLQTRIARDSHTNTSLGFAFVDFDNANVSVRSSYGLLTYKKKKKTDCAANADKALQQDRHHVPPGRRQDCPAVLWQCLVRYYKEREKIVNTDQTGRLEDIWTATGIAMLSSKSTGQPQSNLRLPPWNYGNNHSQVQRRRT